ncbi:hypothetical protein Q5752_002821 [Cryptotrichosporon argae]
MFATVPRLFSNKENAYPAYACSPTPPSPSPSSSRKPRVAGLGPTPRRREHAPKPYTRPPRQHAHARSTSVQRAKKASLSPSPAPPSLPPTRDAADKRAKRRPPPINTRLPAARPAPGPAEPRRTARIPLRIPMPSFPPIADVGVEIGSSVIPAKYVAAKLAPHLYNLLLVSSLFRPYPSIAPPSSPAPLRSSAALNTLPRARPHSIAFAIPQVINGSDPKLPQRTAGLEPDVCLAISQRGKPELGCKLVPTTNIVYASKCAYWPGVPAPASIVERETDLGASTLSVIAEEEDVKSDIDAKPAVTAPSSPVTPKSASYSSPSSQPPSSPSSAAIVDGPYRHLPVATLDLPSSATFTILHTHLHLPSRPLALTLLGLEREVSPSETRDGIAARLQGKSTPELMALLERIHGVWQNVCALGISSEATWAGMGEAWGCVVGVLAVRTAGSGLSRMDGMDED